MTVRLIKSIEKNGKTRPIGRVLNIIRSEALELIAEGKAVEYTDGLPVKKVKTEFFKPK